jgi:outer membrane protein TolC
MTHVHRAGPVALLALAALGPLARGQGPAPAPVPPPLTLAECIQTGLERQPSLLAARASLAAARDNQRALEDLRLAGLVSHEVPIRRQQAAAGVVIAQSGVAQAEWETLYAITRNFYSAVYAHKQERLAAEVVNKLKLYREKAAFLVKKGDPDSLVTQVDVDKLAASTDLYELMHIKAAEGLLRAKAALREAMGLEPDCSVWLVDADLPPPQTVPSRDELLALALGRRGELVQASGAARVTELEADAQAASHELSVKTFAAAADVHSRAVPQGKANKEYRPWAVGPDMPTVLVGRKDDRVRRARDLGARAAAVVEKTRNLIALELDDAYLNWREASRKLEALSTTRAKAAGVLKSTESRFEIGRITGADLILAKTLELQVLAEYNEALYHQALALAALERITAGGFRIGHEE